MRHAIALLTSSILATPGIAQQTRPAEHPPADLLEFPPPPEALWFAGDTHEHVQYCDSSFHPLEEIVLRMKAEGLAVANVLVWDRPSLPFTAFVCLVTGQPDPLSTSGQVLQYAVETSQLDGARWGHLIGTGIGPDEARIAQGSLSEFACDEMPGLGLGCPGGDGTGVLSAPIAQHFLQNPRAVTGYAHTAWSLGLYHPSGYDWNLELIGPGFTTDTRFLDPAQRLAFPNLTRLLEVDPLLPRAILHGGPLRAFFPLLGAMDAALGNVDFFETTFLGASLPQNLMPPANWNQMYYKLLSSGLRVGLSGGSDRACPSVYNNEPVRTHVLLDDGLSFQGWIEGLAAGRTTLSLAGLRLDLRFGPLRIGDELSLPASGAGATARVEVSSVGTLSDCVELVVNGSVVATQPVELPVGGIAQLTFPTSFPASAWVAARLCSQRAHTGAVYVVVDDRPIADPLQAEYWMVWCDAVRKRALADPNVFECQQVEALDEIAQARRAFQSLRDVPGFDPGWQVSRFGRSTRACRGPLAAGITGPVVAGQPFLLTCLNAPPEALGEVRLARAPDPAQPCVDGVRRLVSSAPGDEIGVYPAVATRSGYAEVLVPALPVGVGDVYAQFTWSDPGGCAGQACDGGSGMLSASDGLHAVVQ